MSIYDFKRAVTLSCDSGTPFYSLIMAAMMGADTDNIDKLRREWPDIWAELDKRYHSPGGFIGQEKRDMEHNLVLDRAVEDYYNDGDYQNDNPEDLDLGRDGYEGGGR